MLRFEKNDPEYVIRGLIFGKIGSFQQKTALLKKYFGFRELIWVFYCRVLYKQKQQHDKVYFRHYRIKI